MGIWDWFECQSTLLSVLKYLIDSTMTNKTLATLEHSLIELKITVITYLLAIFTAALPNVTWDLYP